MALGNEMSDSLVSIDERKKVLEAAIGEGLDAIIPDKILEATIAYLDAYKLLESEMSWISSPERMGR